MSEMHDAEQGVEAAIKAYLEQVYEDPVIVTGWVVVAEVMHSDGEPELYPFATDGMPYWKINGLLWAAPDEMVYCDAEDEDAD
jgi:hypothetical protein